MAAVAGAQIIHIAAAFISGVQDVLQIEPISIEMWLLLLPIAGSVLVVMEVNKLARARASWLAK